MLSAESALRAADGEKSAVRFDTKFGRNLEYYSGFIFEISDGNHPDLRQIAGGGRYDRLMTGLGSQKEIPATGCAIYVDRLMTAAGPAS
ncbi:MAG: ATP phosphoribosyltransferase regulatory subunit [Fimbriimonadaceae bacterium]|nr:ATP phosphoribosyltransferase regulatory subunit [Alphaproteobacteria bacterium]